MKAVIEAPLQEFDLARLVQEMDLFSAIAGAGPKHGEMLVVVHNHNDLELLEVYGYRHLLSRLKSGTVFFLDFHTLNEKGMVQCVDGTSRRTDGTVVEKGHEGEYEGFCEGDQLCHGYLLAVSRGMLTVELAAMCECTCTPPSPTCVLVIDERNGFYAPMLSFLNRFVQTPMPTPSTGQLAPEAQRPG